MLRRPLGATEVDEILPSHFLDPAVTKIVALAIELPLLPGLDMLASNGIDFPLRFRRRHRQQRTIPMIAKATMLRPTPRMIPSFLSPMPAESFEDGDDVCFDWPPPVVDVDVDIDLVVVT